MPTLAPIPLALPRSARLRVAAAARASVLEVEALAESRPVPMPGPAKFKRAEALTIRKLKGEDGDGIGGGMPPGIREMLDQLDEKKLGEAAGDAVDTVADIVEEAEGCRCDRRALALLRAIVQASVETAVGFI